MEPQDQQRVRDIGTRRTWRNPAGVEADFLTGDEIENLTIRSGTLTAMEREVINHHIVATIRMLEALPWPKHLKNVNIPLGARIIAVADYYDTAIYSSPDFSEKTKAEVTREIFSGSSILFDPEVIAAFIKVLFHKTDLK